MKINEAVDILKKKISLYEQGKISRLVLLGEVFNLNRKLTGYEIHVLSTSMIIYNTEEKEQLCSIPFKNFLESSN